MGACLPVLVMGIPVVAAVESPVCQRHRSSHRQAPGGRLWPLTHIHHRWQLQVANHRHWLTLEAAVQLQHGAGLALPAAVHGSLCLVLVPDKFQHCL